MFQPSTGRFVTRGTGCQPKFFERTCGLENFGSSEENSFSGVKPDETNSHDSQVLGWRRQHSETWWVQISEILGRGGHSQGGPVSPTRIYLDQGIGLTPCK